MQYYLILSNTLWYYLQLQNSILRAHLRPIQLTPVNIAVSIIHPLGFSGCLDVPIQDHNLLLSFHKIKDTLWSQKRTKIVCWSVHQSWIAPPWFVCLSIDPIVPLIRSNEGKNSQLDKEQGSQGMAVGAFIGG